MTNSPSVLVGQQRAERLENLLALAVALLADERGISVEQVRDRLWEQPVPSMDPQPSGPRLLRLKDVKAKVGFSQAMIYRWMASGTFPRPLKLGASSAWRESDIDLWIAERKR